MSAIVNTMNNAFRAPTEYICVTNNRIASGFGDTSFGGPDVSRLGLVQSNCFAEFLPCNLYPDFAILPCVVCSI